jgi:hypothetical protein
MSDLETRRQLLQAAARDEHELERAIGDLKRAVRRPFDVGARLRAHIHAHPVAWLIGSLLLGLWLGSPNGRSSAHETKEVR